MGKLGLSHFGGIDRISLAIVFDLLNLKLVNMTTIDISAQQIVVDALAKNPKNSQKTILCHTPSKLSAEHGMY